MFESDILWVCTCPSFEARLCDSSEDSLCCSECVYAMDPSDLPEDFV